MKAYSVGDSGGRDALRLHLNEYRYPHPAEVVDALRAAGAALSPKDLLTNYQSGPDPALAADLARYVGAPDARNVLVTPGSDEALRAIIDTSGLRGHHTTIIGVPSYTHFEHHARLKALDIVTYSIGLETTAADLEASLRYHADLLEAGSLVYLCSPNNPTGDLWPRAAVTALAAEYPKSLFVVDEAYIEFASVADVVAGAPAVATSAAAAAELFNKKSLDGVALTCANVVVTRTLSKAFGLAALRLGYVVGLPETLGAIGVAINPKAFGPVAPLVARAALRALPQYLQAAIAARREAAAVSAALKAAGWWALDTPGNFFLVYVAAAASVSAVLAARGVQVRNRDDLPGLAGFVRITAGTAADSAEVLAAFASMAPPAEPPPQLLYSRKGHIAACKALLKKTLDVLHGAGFEFFATAGTLLGMVRHGGMIPTDDDCDLAYVRRSPERDEGLDLVAPFREAGLAFQRNRTDAYWQVGTNAPLDRISSVHVDFFSYRLAGAGGEARYELDDERFRREDPGSSQAHCNTAYAPEELFPLRHGLFYDLAIPMPAMSERVLRRALGADFMQVMRVRTPSGPVEVQLTDYTPA